jgi:hypothetical protein
MRRFKLEMAHLKPARAPPLFSSQSVLKWLSARLTWFERAIGLVLLGFAFKLAGAALK